MKKIAKHLLQLSLAIPITCSMAMATAPTITSAIKSGTTLTISGSNFGTKSTAAPYFFQPFTATSNGDSPATAGFDSWINRGAEAVVMSDGVGGGSLRIDPASNEQPHIGVYLPEVTSKSG